MVVVLPASRATVVQVDLIAWTWPLDAYGQTEHVNSNDIRWPVAIHRPQLVTPNYPHSIKRRDSRYTHSNANHAHPSTHFLAMRPWTLTYQTKNHYPRDGAAKASTKFGDSSSNGTARTSASVQSANTDTISGESILWRRYVYIMASSVLQRT